MSDIAIPRLPRPPHENDLGEQIKAIGASVGRGFIRGVSQLGSFGLAIPRAKVPRQRSDAEALAGDWETVGNGLKVSVRWAKCREQR